MADNSPDDMEAIKAELMKRGALPSNDASAAPSAPSDGGLLQNGDTTDSFGFMSHPIANTMKGVNAVQDFAGGVMGGAQRLGATIGQAVEYPTHAAYQAITGNKVPHYNVREMFGLEGENPVDLRKSISHNPDSFMSGMGGIAPAIAAGGASIPGQIAAQGLWGAVQADPGQENLGGYMPSGRIGAGLTDAGLTAAGAAAFKYAPSVLKYGMDKVKSGLEYLNPSKDAAAFLKKLGSGTKEENVQSLARDIQQSHEANRSDALSHKTPIYEQEAGTDIYKTPVTALPEGNLDKVAYYIAPGEKPKPEQLDALAKEIKNFRQGWTREGKDKVPYTIDDFTHEAGNIFKADMNETQVANLENALNIPTETPGNFRALAEKNGKVIQGNTNDSYQKFIKKPTLANADALQSQLGDDWGYYDNLRKQGKLEPAQKPIMEKIKELRDSLKSEMGDALHRKNPKYTEEIAKFNQKYRENVVPYGEENFTQNIVGEGKSVRDQRAANPSLPFNVTSTEAASYFANPSRAALKVSGDIGEAGRNKILYNLLADETNPKAEGLANAILKAKQSQGYSRYITPEMEDLAKQLLKRTKWQNRAKWGIGGLAGTIGAGSLYEAGKKLI